MPAVYRCARCLNRNDAHASIADPLDESLQPVAGLSIVICSACITPYLFLGDGEVRRLTSADVAALSPQERHLLTVGLAGAVLTRMGIDERRLDISR